MSTTPVRTAWRAPAAHTDTGGGATHNRRQVVRGRGPGEVAVRDELVDEEAVRRGCEHHSVFGRFPFTSLTYAERREVVLRLRARRMAVEDIASYLGAGAHVIRAYAHWADTGEWISPNDVTRELARRRNVD